MFKKVEEAYAYYLSQCEEFEKCKKKSIHVYSKYFMYTTGWKNIKEWSIKLDAIEKALNLSDKEKRR